MYTNLYVYMAPRLYMSGKLYWRMKKDGKWTWTPAHVELTDGWLVVEPLMEEEE